MLLKIPRVSEGEAIRSVDWNAMAEAVERADSLHFDASSGLQATKSGNQRRVSFEATDTKLYVSLTQTLPAGDGLANMGYGKGKVMIFQPGEGTANGTLSIPTDAIEEDIYNFFNVGIKSGSTVIAFRTGGGWLQLDTTLCTNQSA